jgi:NAD(P) transhydrogenase
MRRPGCASYDLVVVGSGPAGQEAALEAAACGGRVAVVERDVVGGLSAYAGMIPAQTLRAAIVELTGRVVSVYERRRKATYEIAIDDLLWRTQPVIEHESDAVLDRFRRSGIRVLQGTASFSDPHTLRVRRAGALERVRAERVVLAVGTHPNRPAAFAFDGRTVVDSDEIALLRDVPRTLAVIGAGPTGLEYASMLAALGVQVTLVDSRPHLLHWLDHELLEALQYHLRGLGVVFRLGDGVTAVETGAGGPRVRFESGEALGAEAVLVASGRHATTEDLELGIVGLTTDARGRIPVDRELRTARPHIFAAGDAAGSSGTASAAIEQGRLAALAAFGRPIPPRPAISGAVSTIPELAFVGSTEQELSSSGIPYVAGVANYRDLVRAEVAGDRAGLLKLLAHADSRRLLGVHILGTAAAELVHIGQAAMAGELTVDYFADAVVNVPTFSAAYREAALDAVARLRGREREAASAA